MYKYKRNEKAASNKKNPIILQLWSFLFFSFFSSCYLSILKTSKYLLCSRLASRVLHFSFYSTFETHFSSFTLFVSSVNEMHIEFVYIRNCSLDKSGIYSFSSVFFCTIVAPFFLRSCK